MFQIVLNGENVSKMFVDYKLIGNRIKTERKTRGLTQEVLAEKLGVSIGYVSQVERGITKISLDLLGEISDVFGCDIASLITESVVSSKGYLRDEIVDKISGINGRKKQLLLDFINLLYEA